MEISIIENKDTLYDIFPEEPEKSKKRWYHYMFAHLVPTKKSINLYLTQLILLIFFCLFLYGMLNKNALPGSEVFAIFFIAFIALLGGKFIQLFKLPPLLGMMIVGFMFRNIEFIPYYKDISKNVISSLKLVALSIILLKAGLGVDMETLKTLKCTVLRLTCIPLFVEALTICIFGHYLLNLPWIFSTMLGFIISAIAPEVILPVVLYLEEVGYGVKKGIPTLLIAASSLDDICAIAGFMMCFSIAFSTSELVWTIIKGPLEPLVGFAYGTIFGFIFWNFPSTDRKMFVLVYYNVLLMWFAAMTNMFMSNRLSIPGAGPLGCIILSFVASISWRKDIRQFEAIQGATNLLWEIIQPFLFSLIGAEVTVKVLKDTAGSGVLTLVLGLICRAIGTILTCSRTGFNMKEKIFMCCAWLPKATVQAAIGSHALNYARAHSLDEELLRHGIVVLNISVLSILLTAPLGAALISLLAPVLLTKDKPFPPLTDESEESSSPMQEQGTKAYSSTETKSSKDSLVHNI